MSFEIGDHLTVDGFEQPGLRLTIDTPSTVLDEDEARELRAAITRWLHDDPQGLGD